MFKRILGRFAAAAMAVGGIGAAADVASAQIYYHTPTYSSPTYRSNSYAPVYSSSPRPIVAPRYIAPSQSVYVQPGYSTYPGNSTVYSTPSGTVVRSYRPTYSYDGYNSSAPVYRDGYNTYAPAPSYNGTYSNGTTYYSQRPTYNNGYQADNYYGVPSYGSSPYGSPAYGSPTYGSSIYGSPAYGTQGGNVGAAIGNALGGQRGAAIGAAIGAAVNN